MGFAGGVTEFRALRADTLVLDTTQCPLASVTRLDVRRGQSHVKLGAGIGFAAGALGGIVYCTALDSSGCQVFDTDYTWLGALIGAGERAAWWGESLAISSRPTAGRGSSSNDCA